MTCFAERMADFIGKPFRAGSHGPEGYDCIGLLYAAQKALGRAVPETFRGYSVHDPAYADLWQENRLAALRLIVELIEGLGEPVDPNYLVAGDVLLVKRRDNGDIFPAIHIGNNLMISAFVDEGVKPVDLGAIHADIIQARRLKHGY